MKPTPEALVNFRADLQRRVLATLPAGGTASGGPPNGIGSAS
jgi:hypothetical protein